MRLLPLAVSLLLALPTSALDLEFVEVRNAGNAADSNGRGAVGYDFEISKYEITVAQYTEFLNAVATEVDTYGLYADKAGISFPVAPIGFERFYEVDPGFANEPVSGVSFWDATRFANWLHNGQPTGLQGSATTEDGAYTLLSSNVISNLVVRNVDARVFVPSDDEWYKAAFYDPELPGYYEYPAGYDVQTVCSAPSAAANRANCFLAVGGFTNVGAYPGSASPYGTFDQGGNAREWVEERANHFRWSLGGVWYRPAGELAKGSKALSNADSALSDQGFRVAQLVPEPSVASLAAIGGLMLVAARRRRRG